MRGIRTIAYVSVALLLADILALGAVFPKTGNGNILNYCGDFPRDDRSTFSY